MQAYLPCRSFFSDQTLLFKKCNPKAQHLPVAGTLHFLRILSVRNLPQSLFTFLLQLLFRIRPFCLDDHSSPVPAVPDHKAGPSKAVFTVGFYLIAGA